MLGVATDRGIAEFAVLQKGR